MDSAFPAFSSFFFFFILLIFSVARSSTIGVDHISRLLEIQDRERALPSVQVAAAQGVLRRLLPSHSSSFEFQIVSKERCGGKSCFIISNHPSFSKQRAPEILIGGFTGVELSAGLHWYLKHWCGAHISWDKTGGVQLSSVPNPGSLPRVQAAGILIQRPVPWNYYQNAVSSSYSFAWWDWERWEEEIDWMALQGINLPLAFTGQEAIWKKVFQIWFIAIFTIVHVLEKKNVHISEYAFGWGGPLPQSWFDQQLILQKKILSRMYELGMTPVLPAFSGNVPEALKSIFPSAKITRLGNWFTVRSDPRWCCTYLLDATDPLFIEIGKAFIEQQLKGALSLSLSYAFLLKKFLSFDTFDENTPPVDDPEYISSLGAAIFRGMQSGDDDSVWLMQALLHSVPMGRLVVLDLFAEVKPIWITSEQCMLHNFAGNIEMYGILDAIASGPVDARTSENSTMASLSNLLVVGVGMSMEGVEQNPIVYDLMSEMAFQHNKLDVKDKNRDVIVAFPDVDPSFISVLQICTSGRHQGYSEQVSQRALLKETTNSFDQPHLWYKTTDVIHALELFIASGDELSESQTYRYDLVDLTRQALAKYANQLFLKIIEAYQFNNAHGVAFYSQNFLDLVKDMDTLLACHSGFLLGPWLDSAKKLAQDPEQEKQFEWNARTQITMWFDNTEEEASLLRDYGNKYWSGLLRDYYGPRAAIYFRYLMESLEKGDGFQLKGWRREWIKLTNDWQSSRKVVTVVDCVAGLVKGDGVHGKVAEALVRSTHGFGRMDGIMGSKGQDG
ncbi:hypothetical protein HHK36_015206 [Tetracentron sinense]|uniref:Alpha-N-acetylglucosaminidase n=1 Tax=Tetracentron sinense TaxID=13715 RepID=A0A834Z5Q0_TETSI|nr:hypothetical protein HHK36_015206 [Tetracentron sinense]